MILIMGPGSQVSLNLFENNAIFSLNNGVKIAYAQDNSDNGSGEEGDNESKDSNEGGEEGDNESKDSNEGGEEGDNESKDSNEGGEE
ncbi:MAG: hypothetical protein AB7P56_07130, partial [Nitrososphaeraceae archaeon]